MVNYCLKARTTLSWQFNKATVINIRSLVPLTTAQKAVMGLKKQQVYIYNIYIIYTYIHIYKAMTKMNANTG